LQVYLPNGEAADAVRDLDDAIGFTWFKQREAEAVIVKIARVARRTIVNDRWRVVAVAEEEEPGIDSGAEVEITGIMAIPGLYATAKMLSGDVAHFGKREQQPTFTVGHGVGMKTPYDIIRM